MMGQLWFWFGVGVAYLLLSIVNFYLAIHLRRIDVPSLARYRISHSEEEREKLSKLQLQSVAEEQKRFEEGKKSREEVQFAIDMLKMAHKEFSEMTASENLNKAFDNIENFANEFNKATKVNHWILYAAAASLFIAAIVSFFQGLN